eukprot:gene11594-4837_t
MSHLGKIDGRETEWTNAQRQLGNVPELEEEVKDTGYESPSEDEIIHGKLSGKTLEQMDEFEDEIDELILMDYKKQRMAQLQQHAKNNSYGSVKDFSANEWKEEVSNCRGIWVLIHLYAPGSPKCEQIDQILGELSKKHPEAKFLRIRASNAIKNFPENNCPTILAYKDGEMQTQFQKFGAEPNVNTLDWAFSQKKIWTTTLQSDPNKKKDPLQDEVFHKVADQYDLMNDAMSMGIHRLWKDDFVSQIKPKPGMNILDMAGGTGDIAFRLAESMRSSTSDYEKYKETSKITVCDINSSMLQVGKERYKKMVQNGLIEFPKIEFLEQNAEELKDIPDNSLDLYTISFGIRNVPKISKAISEAYRVLKKGGAFFCLEFSHVETPFLKEFYDLYSFQVIPELGHYLINDKESYQYLVESIRIY